MIDDSPYGPDRSLLHAVLILVGGLGTIAAGFYLLTTIDKALSDESQVRRAEAPTQASPRSPAPRGPTAGRGVLGPEGGSALVGGGVPAWAGTGRQSAPSGQLAQVPQGGYGINPDLDHAQLGSPSAPARGGSGDGAAVADASTLDGDGSTGNASKTAFSAPDLSGESFEGAATGGDAPGWRSEARTLASRSRALSSELGRIDEERSREVSSSRSENEGSGPLEDASTATGIGPLANSGPTTPDDPNQVPIGGTEWLAAAGAAYAINRLRKRDATGSESEDDS